MSRTWNQTRTLRLSVVGTVGATLLAGCTYTEFTMVDDAGHASPVIVTTSESRASSVAAHDGGAKTSGSTSRDAGASDASVTRGDAASDTSPEEPDASSPLPDAGSDAAADTAVAPPCDGTQPPSVDACVLGEAYGVFVATSASGGSDTTGTGTRKKPYATITNAITHLGALSRVYVCNGGYTDQVTVTGAVAIYGGMTCGGAVTGGTSGPWAYEPGTTASVTGSSPAFALEVNAGSSAVDVEDMTFNAAAGTVESPSSVAVFVVSSPSVVLRRSVVLAGTGFPGANGAAGAAGALADAMPATELNGRAATPDGGGGTTLCTCVGGSISAGGAATPDGATISESGQPRQTVPSPPTATGAGQTVLECFQTKPNISGVNGSDAVPAAAPDGAAASLGTLDATGWHPGNGTSGSAASPGQGGGGGGALFGGGGACGGCGGLAGTFGTGGGGSIALLAIASPVQLVGVTLTAVNGGAGGAGGPGGAGQLGGMGGATILVKGIGGCPGGNGGKGAAGGGGGGGAGGVSFGILYQGAMPVADMATTMSAGAAGAAGVGGDPRQNDGVPGVSTTMQDVSLL